MRADNTAHLLTAAQRRHELTRAKAIRALRELDHTGSHITFENVARRAEVSCGVHRSCRQDRGQPDQHLTEENRRLRRQLEQALGERRANRPPNPPRPIALR